MSRTVNMEPTAKQLAILAFMVDFHRKHLYPASLRDIAEHYRILHVNNVACQIEALCHKGLVRRVTTPRGRNVYIAEEMFADSSALATAST